MQTHLQMTKKGGKRIQLNYIYLYPVTCGVSFSCVCESLQSREVGGTVKNDALSYLQCIILTFQQSPPFWAY